LESLAFPEEGSDESSSLHGSSPDASGCLVGALLVSHASLSLSGESLDNPPAFAEADESSSSDNSSASAAFDCASSPSSVSSLSCDTRAVASGPFFDDSTNHHFAHLSSNLSSSTSVGNVSASGDNFSASLDSLTDLLAWNSLAWLHDPTNSLASDLSADSSSSDSLDDSGSDSTSSSDYYTTSSSHNPSASHASGPSSPTLLSGDACGILAFFESFDDSAPSELGSLASYHSSAPARSHLPGSNLSGDAHHSILFEPFDDSPSFGFGSNECSGGCGSIDSTDSVCISVSL